MLTELRNWLSFRLLLQNNEPTARRESYIIFTNHGLLHTQINPDSMKQYCVICCVLIPPVSVAPGARPESELEWRQQLRVGLFTPEIEWYAADIVKFSVTMTLTRQLLVVLDLLTRVTGCLLLWLLIPRTTTSI